MKEHIKRRIEYSRDALPEEGTDEYKRVTRFHQKRIDENPELKRMLEEKFITAIKTLEVQNLNGIGLSIGSEIRHFLNEFNHRSWNYGHRKMPIMFNILEAFFKLDKKLNYWELLEEEEYLISYFDFIDYYTSNDFDYDINFIKETLQEDLIYNYNVGADLSEITFKTDEGGEFVIAGISILRRGHEVTFIFLAGEIVDTSLSTTTLYDRPLKMVPGKEMIKAADDRIHEAVKLNENPNWWKTIIACRFDLETQTIDARYVAKDEGSLFSIITDDKTGFIKDREWINSDMKETYDKFISKVENYNSIFELAKASLYLPHYFNSFENDIIEEDHETRLKALISSPVKKANFKNVDDKFKIRNRPLWLLNRKNIFASDRIILRDDKFQIENSGYWKELTPEEFGADKQGRQITGKTWVNKTESYYQAKTADLIVSKTNQKDTFNGINAGYIYIMRNPSFNENIFKIGLTTKETKEREKQLSNTSVPDKFFVMREWAVKNCKTAEKEIHALLDKYRIDPRREFFQINMKLANETIDFVIENINSLE
jgi:hypothetical protein